jgi:hypothetical protein
VVDAEGILGTCTSKWARVLRGNASIFAPRPSIIMSSSMPTTSAATSRTIPVYIATLKLPRYIGECSRLQLMRPLVRGMLPKGPPPPYYGVAVYAGTVNFMAGACHRRRSPLISSRCQQEPAATPWYRSLRTTRYGARPARRVRSTTEDSFPHRRTANTG